jgi:amidohydrolase
MVALRADMDGLPVREETTVPFASRATGEYESRQVGVMHACGHDTHVANLLATAKVLSGMRAQLPGSVTFIFQPAEEGAPLDERPAGAELMVREGVMTGVDAVFGLHVFANVPTGTITTGAAPSWPPPTSSTSPSPGGRRTGPPPGAASIPSSSARRSSTRSRRS